MEYRAITDSKSFPRNIGSSATDVRKEETLTKMTEMLFYPELIGMNYMWMEKPGLRSERFYERLRRTERADEP